MTEDEALAIGFANLKGPRAKRLLLTARALQFLKSLPRYGSNAKVGEVFGVSGETVREFLVLLQLPPEIQRILDQRQLSLDQGRRLWQLGRKRPDLLEEAARAMADLTVVESRQLIDYILKRPDLSVAQAKQHLLATQTVIEQQFHVMAMLPEAQFRLLQQRAQQRKMVVNDLVTMVVQHWLEANDSDR